VDQLLKSTGRARAQTFSSGIGGDALHHLGAWLVEPVARRPIGRKGARASEFYICLMRLIEIPKSIIVIYFKFRSIDIVDVYVQVGYGLFYFISS
jgi:hypothetical protein